MWYILVPLFWQQCIGEEVMPLQLPDKHWLFSPLLGLCWTILTMACYWMWHWFKVMLTCGSVATGHFFIMFATTSESWFPSPLLVSVLEQWNSFAKWVAIDSVWEFAVCCKQWKAMLENKNKKQWQALCCFLVSVLTNTNYSFWHYPMSLWEHL